MKIYDFFIFFSISFLMHNYCPASISITKQRKEKSIFILCHSRLDAGESQLTRRGDSCAGVKCTNEQTDTIDKSKSCTQHWVFAISLIRDMHANYFLNSHARAHIHLSVFVLQMKIKSSKRKTLKITINWVCESPSLQMTFFSLPHFALIAQHQSIIASSNNE